MNIKITKSTYKTKENKRAIIYDCSAKNYRKKINTGIFVEDGYLDNPEITLSIALNITLEKLKDKKEDALAKYVENNWSFNELENYLKKGIDIYSIEEYVKNDFAKNKNIITGNDYFNVIKVFKKHLNKVNISFNDLLENNTILEFKLKAQRNGVKVTSINSYIKKIGVIMNQAFRDGFITRRFVIPKYVLEYREKKLEKVLFDKDKFIEAINNSENIFQVQSLSIFLMLVLCGGMRPSDLVNYEVHNNNDKNDLLGTMIYENNISFLKFKKSNKGDMYKYVKLSYIKIKIIELVKTLFYITHQKKYPHIISSYSNQYKIFNFDIEKENNLYRNLWNFYQLKIKEVYDLKFSDAKGIYYDKLNEIEMNKITSDILFAKAKEVELIGHKKTKILKENIEKCEKKISRIFSANELLQVIINKLIFLGIDLNNTRLEDVETPMEFSSFLLKISKYRRGL